MPLFSNGDLISRPLVHSVTTLLHTFSPDSHSALYLDPLVVASHVYYQAEGARLAAELDSSAYLAQVERRLGEEAERAQLVLGVELEERLQRVVLDEMAATHVEAIVEKDLGAMITEERRADLSSVYSLLSRVASVAPLRAAFLEYLKVSPPRQPDPLIPLTDRDRFFPADRRSRDRSRHLIRRPNGRSPDRPPR